MAQFREQSQRCDDIDCSSMASNSENDMVGTFYGSQSRFINLPQMLRLKICDRSHR